ncbi:MAG: DNA double-strand break repair nuclease NurA [Dehalococcoidia bacterium]|nr:DNA double-strand break repair nuclease NurA [Dehalococcoidia bacterium]
MTAAPEHPFAELPASLVDEVLQRTGELSKMLLADFAEVRSHQKEWRHQLADTGLLRRDSDLPYVAIPTTCGVDGSFAIERLLATDLIAAAAVAVEGLTPPSETRHWPEPRHLVLFDTEAHEADTGTILRGLMVGMELELAASAPHEVVFLDGSLTTPFIFFNQSLNKAKEAPHLRLTNVLVQQINRYLGAYDSILSSTRTDRCWLAVPKYSTRSEIGQKLGWPGKHDDRGLLSLILQPGEFTQPRPLQQPPEPWHLNVGFLPTDIKSVAGPLSEKIIASLDGIRVLYYRPYPWLPALRLETSRAVADNPARLATVIHGVRHQCGTPAVMEPYPLYMADRMVKHLPRAIPTFRQVTSQRIAEVYEGDIGDVFLSLHGYRTESGA